MSNWYHALDKMCIRDSPEDIRAVCHDVMRHRIGLSYEAEANNLTSEEVISEILNKVEVP